MSKRTTYVDARGGRPRVVLAQLTGDDGVSELGTRLVDAEVLEERARGCAEGRAGCRGGRGRRRGGRRRRRGVRGNCGGRRCSCGQALGVVYGSHSVIIKLRLQAFPLTRVELDAVSTRVASGRAAEVDTLCRSSVHATSGYFQDSLRTGRKH